MSRPDLDELLTLLFEFAQLMLRQSGEFYPFAAAVKRDGQIQSIGGNTGDEHPLSQDLIVFLAESLKREAAEGKIRASGICTDVRIVPPGGTEKSDAICALLEHEDGEAVEVFMPYRKTRSGNIKYSNIFATAVNADVFSEPLAN
jgi:hypothetical protein